MTTLVRLDLNCHHGYAVGMSLEYVVMAPVPEIVSVVPSYDHVALSPHEPLVIWALIVVAAAATSRATVTLNRFVLIHVLFLK
jgi:hypothetical protein